MGDTNCTYLCDSYDGFSQCITGMDYVPVAIRVGLRGFIFVRGQMSNKNIQVGGGRRGGKWGGGGGGGILADYTPF